MSLLQPGETDGDWFNGCDDTEQQMVWIEKEKLCLLRSKLHFSNRTMIMLYQTDLLNVQISDSFFGFFVPF